MTQKSHNIRLFAVLLTGLFFAALIIVVLSEDESNSQLNVLPTLAQFSGITPTPLIFTTQTAPAAVQANTFNGSITLPSQPVANRLVITFATGSTREAQNAYITSIGGTITKMIESLNTAIVTIPSDTQIEGLPSSQIVVTSEPDYFVAAQTNDPFFTQQWAPRYIHADVAWQEFPSDTPYVTVAVIDSGICSTHADLMGRIVEGYDFVDSDLIAQDEYGHGCAVSGVIAANIDNASGIAGIAPNAQIMPLRALDSSGIGTYSDVALAITYAVDHNAQIINLSLGGSFSSEFLARAVDYAISRGVLVIAAGGNTGSAPLYPAAYEPVIAVGSINEEGLRSAFSSSGDQIDIYAPGESILTTAIDGSYVTVSGTSFAAPHVAGIAALEMAFGRSLTLGGIVSFGGANPQIITATTTPDLSPDDVALLNTMRSQGKMRVIVSLNVSFQAEGLLPSNAAIQAQQVAIAQAQQSLISALTVYNAVVISQSDQWVIPAIAFEVDESALLYLMSSPQVIHIQEDIALPPLLNTSVGIIDAPETWDLGYTGQGKTVVILDTGIEATHNTFGGRVATEACYSWNQSDNLSTVQNETVDSLCPGGGIVQIGAGAADLSRCQLFGLDCSHGTHVAGIAAGGDATYTGVAPEASLVGIQIFSRFEDCNATVGGNQQCALSYTADQISGLNLVYNSLRHSYDVAAVNMSLGGGQFSTYCDSYSPAMKSIIDQLLAVNIATVIAAGNSGYTDAVSFPACISTAVTVASTTDSDVVSGFSNTDDTVDLLAPGSSIISALPGNSFGSKSGTSMSSPHVAGAWAVLRQEVPTISVADLLSVFQSNGVALTVPGGTTLYRIDLDNTAIVLRPPPTPTATPIPDSFTTITDQEFLYILQSQIDPPLNPILVIFSANRINIYVEANSFSGVALITVTQGDGVSVLRLENITAPDETPAPQAFIDSVSLYLPAMLTAALDTLMVERFGADHDLNTLQVRANAIDITIDLQP